MEVAGRVHAHRPVAVARRAHAAWSGPAARHASGALLLAACALLFMSAAGTIQVVYTVRASQVLVPLACAVGLPFVWRGCARLPPAATWAARGLLLAYLLATVVGDQRVIPGEPRAGEYRYAVYLFEIVSGLAVVGLVAGLWPTLAALRPVIAALVFGAALAALYGLYQWPAQRFGWPLEHVLSVRDSNGDVDGFQGYGLLGWERIRGTFLEPHFLAGYLTSVLPLASTAAVLAPGRRRAGALVVTVAIAAAALLTASVPAWVSLALAAFIGVAIFAVARGLSLLAAALGAMLVTAALMGPFLVAFPETLAKVTGRSEQSLATTAGDRTEAWTRAVDIWSSRPVAGHGPGQSSVILAAGTEGRLDSGPGRPLLGTPYGLWAASLIDAGLIGFYTWLLFLGTALVVGARALLRAPSALRLGVFLGATAAVVGSEVAGDRLDLRAWILIGVLLAASSGREAEGDPAAGDEQARAGAA